MTSNLNILASFDSIVDTDMGLLRLIRMDYNTDFFFPGIVNNEEDNQHYVLSLRDNPNPLSVVMDYETDEEKEVADNLFKQFKDQEYQKILDLSPLSTFNMIIDSGSYLNPDMLRVDVYCNTQEEADILSVKEVKYRDSIIVERDKNNIYKNININKYNAVVVKDLSELDYIYNLKGKIIYIPSYHFNVASIEGFKDAVLPEWVIEKYGNTNDFQIYSAYVFKD